VTLPLLERPPGQRLALEASLPGGV
jgi:hypothetical protein